jgi:hypothetical protein
MARDLSRRMWGACKGRSHDSGQRISEVQIRFTGVQEVKLDKVAIVREEDYTSFYGKKNENQELETWFFSTTDNRSSS